MAKDPNDNLENQMRKLRLCQPSTALDRRMADLFAGRMPKHRIHSLHRAIPLSYAVAACIVIGATAFFSGLYTRPLIGPYQSSSSMASPSPTPVVSPQRKIVIIKYQGQGQNFLDFTNATPVDAQPTFSVKVTKEKES